MVIFYDFMNTLFPEMREYEGYGDLKMFHLLHVPMSRDTRLGAPVPRLSQAELKHAVARVSPNNTSDMLTLKCVQYCNMSEDAKCSGGNALFVD